MEDCKSSGLTIRAWCKENKVSASQYHYWINKLYK
ncbi:IS66 family insertion sequence element accessory protein TnpA [Clostridium botulinum]